MAKRKQLSYSDISYLCEQLSALVSSGVTVGESLEILSESSSGGYQKLLRQLSDRVVNGAALSAAAKETGVFPEYFVLLTAVGEQSGRLDETLASLGTYFGRMAHLRESVRSAVRYPAVMTGVMLAVLAVILTQAMPIFANVYEQLGESMGGAMAALLSAGNWLSKNWLIILAIIAAITAAIAIFRRTKPGKAAGRWLYENSPFTRRISRMDGASRLTYALSLCISSGLGLEDALEMSAGLAGLSAAQQSVKEARELLSKGGTAAEALSKSGILPQKYIAMIAVGERSGNLEHFMRRVCEMSEADADSSADRAVASIEPTVVIVMSVLIGLLLVTVMLPLLGIVAGI